MKWSLLLFLLLASFFIVFSVIFILFFFHRLIDLFGSVCFFNLKKIFLWHQLLVIKEGHHWFYTKYKKQEWFNIHIQNISKKKKKMTISESLVLWGKIWYIIELESDWFRNHPISLNYSVVKILIWNRILFYCLIVYAYIIVLLY